MTIDRGHGDHWGIFGEPEELITGIIPQLTNNGEPVGAGLIRASVLDTPKQMREMLGIRLDENELSSTGIIACCPDLKENSMVSIFPCCYNGMTYEVTVNKLVKWENGFEAIVEVSLEDGARLSFFAIDYYANSKLYKKGNKIRVSISAFAYDAEILPKDERVHAFDEQETLKILANMGEKPEYDENGKMKTLMFNTGGVIALFPHGGNFIDDAEFQSPIQRVVKTSFLGMPLYKLGILIRSKPNMEIPLFVSQKCFKNKPKVGDPIRGVLWLHGCIEL